MITCSSVESAAVIARHRNDRYKHIWNYRPELHIRMRQDDLPLLEWCKAQYGGGTVYRWGDTYLMVNHFQSGISRGYRQMMPLLRVMLETGLPAKKMKEIAFRLEFVELPSHLGVERLQGKYEAIKELRAFQ